MLSFFSHGWHHINQDGTIYKETKEKLSDAIDILFKEEIVPLKGKPIEKIEQKR